MTWDKKIINLLNDNAKIRSETIYKSKQNETNGTGLKILTPKKKKKKKKCFKDYQ